MSELTSFTTAAVSSHVVAAHLGAIVWVVRHRLVPLSYSMLSLPLLFCQQHRLIPEVTLTLHHPTTILYTALVTEGSAAATLHVVAAMTQLNHVLAALALPPAALPGQLHQAAILCCCSLCLPTGLALMPRSPAPEAQQAVAGWALCMHVGTPLIGHHEGAALGVGAVQLGSLWYECFCCHLGQELSVLSAPQN